MVDTPEVAFEVVQTRPGLFIRLASSVAATISLGGLHALQSCRMLAFGMSFQIICSTESFHPCAAWMVATERFGMSQSVFSISG